MVLLAQMVVVIAPPSQKDDRLSIGSGRLRPNPGESFVPLGEDLSIGLALAFRSSQLSISAG
jgi:hypothetical protein